MKKIEIINEKIKKWNEFMSNFVESLMLQIPRSHLHMARGEVYHFNHKNKSNINVK
jgi:hypothetical protein